MKKLFFIFNILSVFQIHSMQNDLFESAKKGDLQTVRFLLENNICDVNDRDKTIYQPYHNPNTVFVVEELDGTTVIIKEQNYTALHYAIQKSNNIELVRYLIEKGANVNAQNAWGSTPLMAAICRFFENPEFYLKVITELLNHRNINLNLRSKTAMHQNALEVIFDLHSPNYDECLKLICFLIPLFLAKGTDINSQDPHGVTPVLRAFAYGLDRQILDQLLIFEKINVNLKSKTGETLLYYAVKSGYDDLVVKFIEMGADVNAKLIPCGISFFPHSNIYASPLHCAVNKRFKKIEKILRKAGATE